MNNSIACPHPPYADITLGVLTQHGKEGILASVLEPKLHCSVRRVPGYDTDQLGTFTRTRERLGTQREAAHMKARLAMHFSGWPVGIGSEGAFGPDPYAGMAPWDTECLVLLDQRYGIGISVFADGPAQHRHTWVADWEALVAFAAEAGFPAHHLVLRPDAENDPRVVAGLATWTDLEAAFRATQAQCRTPSSGRVFVENDLRAHANPTRQGIIRKAAEALAERMASLCPACATPGYWMARGVPGVPCAWCGAPTRLYLADVWECQRCGEKETRPRAGVEAADPGDCDRCNP